MLKILAFPFWNDSERRLRAGVRIVLHLLFVTLLSIGPECAAMQARQASTADPLGLFSHGPAYLLAALVMLFSVAVAARVWDRRRLEGFGWVFTRSAWADLAFGTALGAGLMVGIAVAETALGVAVYREPFVYRDTPLAFASVPTAVVLFVAVSVREEVLFRGYQLTNLAEGLALGHLPRWVAPVLAAVLSSLVFGLFHAGNPHASVLSTVNIMVAGLMLAVPYLLTGDLGLALGLHFSWNFFQNLLDMPVSGQTWFNYSAMVQRRVLGPESLTGGEFGPEAGLTGLVAMGVGNLLILLWIRRRGPLRVHPRFGGWRPNE